MDLAVFESTLSSPTPPVGLPPLIEALWWAGRGDWDRAHALAQNDTSRSGAWVHAYLHRQEGDKANAGYWYRQAGRPHCRLPLPEEWKQIAAELLES